MQVSFALPGLSRDGERIELRAWVFDDLLGSAHRLGIAIGALEPFERAARDCWEGDRVLTSHVRVLLSHSNIPPLRIVASKSFADQYIAAGVRHRFEFDLHILTENLGGESPKASHNALPDPRGYEAVFDGDVQHAIGDGCRLSIC